MSDSLVVAACILIGVFAVAVYLVMAWPFFLAVAALWAAVKVVSEGRRFLKDHFSKSKARPAMPAIGK